MTNHMNSHIVHLVLYGRKVGNPYSAAIPDRWPFFQLQFYNSQSNLFAI